MTVKKRNPFIAALLTFVTLGLGQIYNGQLKRGIFFFLLYAVFLLSFAWSGLLLHFHGLVTVCAICVVFMVFVSADAFLTAVRLKEITLQPYHRGFVYILIAALGVVPLFQPKLAKKLFGLGAYKIPSGSMEPALLAGDHFFVDLKYYRRFVLERGDIVAFPYPPNPEVTYLQRVVAFSGDTVEIKQGSFYLNHLLTAEPYLSDKLENRPLKDFGPVTIPEQQIFVLGDNREDGSDSRQWGCVDASTILGKARYIWWSSNRNRIGKEIQ
jgi:signal peptidase I